MSPLPSLDQIPKGNTCHGVNRAVIESLLAHDRSWAGRCILDMPCGAGVLLKVCRDFFPQADVKGADYRLPEGFPGNEVAWVDASKSFRVFPEMRFDAITSVSGVMEFDNTRQFFESCRAHLKEGGLLVVTNDNVITVRDRLAYLFFARTRQFKLLVTPGEPTWKVILVQNLVRILEDAGFEIRAIRYVSLRAKDWLQLPLALLIWPWQLAMRHAEKSAMPGRLRRMMFPFRALLCRHYVVECVMRTPAAAR
jgi:SAM-dependent methyltransferase